MKERWLLHLRETVTELDNKRKRMVMWNVQHILVTEYRLHASSLTTSTQKTVHLATELLREGKSMHKVGWDLLQKNKELEYW